MTTRQFRQGARTSGPSESPIQRDAVRRQLALLYGESLFGTWPQLREQAAETWPRRRTQRWLWRFAVLLLLCGGVWVASWLLQPGLAHQADQRRDHYAQELKTFIGDGDLERASQFVMLVEQQRGSRAVDALVAKDSHLDLIVLTEAALYRYFDAAPERLQRISRFIDDVSPSTPLRQIAALTVLSREQRAERLPQLERLHNDTPDRNDVDYLLATALEQRGDFAASREAWERSAKLEPAWLGHRFEQVWFELRQDGLESARRVVSDMLRVDPDCPWSKLATSRLELSKDVTPGVLHADAAAPSATPVQIHFQMLWQAIEAAGRQEFSLANARLAASAAAIHYQEPFLLDAFDWCISENAPGLAKELANMPQWPRDSKVARGKLARLSSSSANGSVGSASKAADGSLTDPAAGLPRHAKRTQPKQ